jgi:hypothetical protein
VSSTNGFDSYGHYLRAGLILNTCSTYSITPASDCLAKFNTGSASARAASAATPSYDDTRRSDDLRQFDALLHGKQLPQASAQPQPVGQSGPAAQPQATAAQPQATASQPTAETAKPLLDYLLGGGG